MDKKKERLILATHEFLKKYYDLYPNKNKMSFYELNEYLLSEKREPVTKAGIKITSVKTEDILRNKYTLVEFKGAKIIAINTPLKPLSILQKELDKTSKKELNNIRLQLLKEQGLEEDVFGFVYEKVILPYEEYDEINLKKKVRKKYDKYQRR